MANGICGEIRGGKKCKISYDYLRDELSAIPSKPACKWCLRHAGAKKSEVGNKYKRHMKGE